MLPPESRLPEACALVEVGQYFVVHAPRQTGKTTTLTALARSLTASGRFAALLFSCERAEAAGDDYGAAEVQALTAIRGKADADGLAAELSPPSPWPEASPGSQIYEGLRAWAGRCPQPLVLFFDEIDALRGNSMRSVLSQLRDGFQLRPQAFPSSVALCGLRDVRDYRVASGGDPATLGSASPFNIHVKSLRIGDFTLQDVADLYGQHTADTGQEFTTVAVRRAFDYTQGQPWLVNALAREIVTEMRVPPAIPITTDHVDEAKDRLIRARASHLNSLADKLVEPRVRRVIEPLITGGPQPEIANPIYREVIGRVLGSRLDPFITANPRSLLLPDGCLDLRSCWRTSPHGGVSTANSSTAATFTTKTPPAGDDGLPLPHCQRRWPRRAREVRWPWPRRPPHRKDLDR
jgi:hypothetical protein